MSFDTVKIMLMSYLEYIPEKELRTYLNDIGMCPSSSASFGNLVALVNHYTQNEKHLLLLSRISFISNNDIKTLWGLSDKTIQSMISLGYLKVFFQEETKIIFEAEDVLIMLKYGLPYMFRSHRTAINSSHSSLDGVYVTLEELADIQKIDECDVNQLIRKHKIACIKTDSECMIPLSQFKRPCYWEVL